MNTRVHHNVYHHRFVTLRDPFWDRFLAFTNLGSAEWHYFNRNPFIKSSLILHVRPVKTLEVTRPSWYINVYHGSLQSDPPWSLVEPSSNLHWIVQGACHRCWFTIVHPSRAHLLRLPWLELDPRRMWGSAGSWNLSRTNKLCPGSKNVLDWSTTGIVFAICQRHVPLTSINPCNQGKTLIICGRWDIHNWNTLEFDPSPNKVTTVLQLSTSEAEHRR